jgi:spore maturation protein CgeB
MKILIVDTYYPNFLRSFRRSSSKLNAASYKDYKKLLFKTAFGTSDFYSYNLKRLGHKAEEIVANDEVLQRKWARENNFLVNENDFISKIQNLPYVYRFLGKPKWIQAIALAQIKRYQPDVVYMQDLTILNPTTLKEVKKYCQLLVAQIASPLPPKENLKCFDLIITSFPHYVKLFKKMGIKSEYQKLAFEPRILKQIGKQKRIYDVTFVGSFTPYHQKGSKVLEEVAQNIPVHVWGQGIEFLSPLSSLRKNYHGEAWGLDMYEIFAKSKIVINRHISVAKRYANNTRMFEATGMGALLITDNKENLNDIFIVGKEIVAYRNLQDLVKKIVFYLKNEGEREKIAELGQMKTMNDHSYKIRMEELCKILNKYI